MYLAASSESKTISLSRHSLRGLTLLETLIAMVVLTVAILGLAGVFISGLRLVDASANLTGATNVAREFLETVKERGYSSTSVGTFDGRTPDPANTTTTFPPAPYPTTSVGRQTFTLVVRCLEFSPTIRSVQVDVYWDQDSKASFATMVHQ